MKIVAYARSSPGSPSTAAQLEDIRRWAQQNGNEIVAEIEDDQVSGKNFEDRPNWLKTWAALENADGLVTRNVDRLGRNLKELMILKDKIKERGKFFASSDGTADTRRGAMGEVIFIQLASTAEIFNIWRRERCRNGIERAKEQDKLNGLPSRFGRTPKLKDVSPVLALRREGFSYSQIARKLGVSSPTVAGIIHKRGDPLKTTQASMKEAQAKVGGGVV